MKFDEEERTRAVREAIGPTPTPRDVAAMREALEHLGRAREAFKRVGVTVTPVAVVRHRTGPLLEAALRGVEEELRVMERAVEPLEVGQKVCFLAQEGPNGAREIEAVFGGVSDAGFVLLSCADGRLTEHRMPTRGPYGLRHEEHHRVETWVATRKASGLPLRLRRRSEAGEACASRGRRKEGAAR